MIREAEYADKILQFPVERAELHRKRLIQSECRTISAFTPRAYLHGRHDIHQTQGSLAVLTYHKCHRIVIVRHAPTHC